jgi:hypothetical protein
VTYHEKVLRDAADPELVLACNKKQLHSELRLYPREYTQWHFNAWKLRPIKQRHVASSESSTWYGDDGDAERNELKWKLARAAQL